MDIKVIANYKMRYLLILISIVIISCNHHDKIPIDYSANAPNDSEITLVINSLLKYQFDNPDVDSLCKPLLVMDTLYDRRLYVLSSCMFYQKDSTNKRYIGKNIFTYQDSMFSIWQIENTQPYKIQLNFNGARLVTLKNSRQLETYPDYYNNGCCIYRMTRPLFSVDKKTALIEVASFNKLSSGGNVIIMQKKGDKWEPRADFLSWSACK